MRLPLDTSARAGASSARLVNCHAEVLAPDAKGPARIMRAPGVRSYRSGHGVGRGLHVMGSTLYSVEGDGLYASGARIGDVPGSGPVSIADNGEVMMLATGGAGFICDGTTVIVNTDADFPGAVSFSYLDGYFCFTNPGTQELWTTTRYSLDVPDDLNYAIVDSAPDPITHLIQDHRELILFGPMSVERWYNPQRADADFPLDRSPGGMYEIGCLGGVAKLDNSVFWTADDFTARRLTGTTPVRVSTHAVEERIRAGVGEPRAFSYSLEGHLVYVVSWDNLTLAYDASSGAWHERSSYRNQRWRVCDTAVLNGTVYAQDRETGAVGVLTPGLDTEWGDDVVCQWTYPSVAKEGARLFHSRLELNAEMGYGSQVLLDVSNDGGKNWTGFRPRSMGHVGAYTNRMIWTQLGSAYDRVYRMTVVSGPVSVYGTKLTVT